MGLSRGFFCTKASRDRMNKQKAGLNREMLDTAPASLISMIRYKAEEAGNEIIETPTRKLKPSQRCPKCLHTTKDNRKSQADFWCVACGYRENADVVCVAKVGAS